MAQACAGPMQEATALSSGLHPSHRTNIAQPMLLPILRPLCPFHAFPLMSAEP